MSRRLITLFLAVLLFSFPPYSLAQERSTPARGDWRRVEAITPGRHIIVKTFRDTEAKVKGTFVSAEADSLVVQGKGGRVVLPKEEVRTVMARRRTLRHAHWIGMVAGFAIVALWTTGEGDFVQPSAALIYGTAGAGLGFLGGLGVRGLGQNSVVYRVPKGAWKN